MLLCAGDSLTAGFGGNTPYPRWLDGRLSIETCAGVGWRAEELALALPRALNQSARRGNTLRAAIVCIGFNDICSGTLLETFQTYLQQIAALLADAIDDRHHIAITSIPPLLTSPFYRQPERYDLFAKGLRALHASGKPNYLAFRHLQEKDLIQFISSYNVSLEEAAASHCFTYINIDAFMQQHASMDNHEAYSPADGVHFSDALNQSFATHLAAHHPVLHRA